MKNEWDEKLKFLLAIRKEWCNTDYIEFLIQKVWCIDSAVDVVDFGCGFGYIGLLLLPLLPQGSTYTGIDFSEVLLQEAKKIFIDSPFKTKFFQADLTQYVPSQDYDIAISQAVLRHIPNHKNILDKMIQSIRPNGLVICMETDRLIQEAGKYFSGIDYVELHQIELYEKIWNYELKNGGRDYRTGLKIPQNMQELGLHDIQIRINDCVKFANPHTDNYEAVFNAIIEANGWNKSYSEEEKMNFISVMIRKGLSEDEAEHYLNNEISIQKNIEAGFKKDYIIQMPCTPIIFGRK
ncbi:MAG: Methyltransferase type 12 [Clostridia bacterium]|nr:Methyltransferase type 12 [Clostridia bacterium]